MDTEKYRVFLVDDSPDDRFFERTILEGSSKFTVIGEARDGQEAIEYLEKNSASPDIMLLDLKMPRKNGFDVLRWLSTTNVGNLTVVIMSGSWLSEDIIRSRTLGAHAYFKKPSSREDQEKMILDIENLLHERKNR